MASSSQRSTAVSRAPGSIVEVTASSSPANGGAVACGLDRPAVGLQLGPQGVGRVEVLLGACTVESIRLGLRVVVDVTACTQLQAHGRADLVDGGGQRRGGFVTGIECGVRLPNRVEQQ